MKRPMLWLAGFYMAGLLLGQTLPGWVGFALFAWAAVLFCGGMAKRRRSKLWLVLLLAVALAGGSNLRLSVLPWADWQTVAEAAGTVGLTVGITPTLSAFSLWLLATLMFFGRVGILTIIFALSVKVKKNDELISYPETKYTVG